MIKNLSELQRKAKHARFALRLTEALRSMKVNPNPTAFASAFNQAHHSNFLKPHTVRKWLLGMTQPRSETLLLLTDWLQVDPNYFFNSNTNAADEENSSDLNFADQEAFSKYLTMTSKQKNAIRLLINTIVDKSK